MHRTGLNVPIWNESRRLRYRFVPFFFALFPFITNKLHPSNTNPPRQAMEHLRSSPPERSEEDER